jgi:hypothetical protein
MVAVVGSGGTYIAQKIRSVGIAIGIDQDGVVAAFIDPPCRHHTDASEVIQTLALQPVVQPGAAADRSPWSVRKHRDAPRVVAVAQALVRAGKCEYIEFMAPS